MMTLESWFSSRRAAAAAFVALGLFAAPAAAEETSFDRLFAAPFVSARREVTVEFRAPVGRAVRHDRDRDQDRRDRDRRDRGYGRSARRMCVGTDDGWEEHWRPHGGWGESIEDACRACRAEHGKCDYACSVEAFQCKAEWIPDDGRGTRETYTGRVDDDERDAEDSAVGACRDDHWRSRDEGRCRLISCDSTTRLIDSGRCR